MKRYVRTQDNKIIDLNSGEYIVNGQDLILHKKYETVGGLPSKPETNIQLSVAVITKHNEYIFVGTITKEADTIEELCDEFVAVRKSDNTAHLGKIENTYWFYEQTGWVGRVEDYKIIYGAIWTDKGLTYVAKLNSQGELELL